MFNWLTQPEMFLHVTDQLDLGQLDEGTLIFYNGSLLGTGTPPFNSAEHKTDDKYALIVNTLEYNSCIVYCSTDIARTKV